MRIFFVTDSPYRVAVITSTIGRPTLKTAIESVRAQSYRQNDDAATDLVRHYVFVDGEQHFAAAKQILDEYPDVVAVYLPMNTGADGWTNSSINAIAPFLVEEDLVCFLDDDNRYQPIHIEALVNAFRNNPNLDYAYSRRNYYGGSFDNLICPDNFESIGGCLPRFGQSVAIGYTLKGIHATTYFTKQTRHHIDTNCFCFTLELARHIAPYWKSNKNNDKAVYAQLLKEHRRSTCSGYYSVDYVLDVKNYMKDVFNTVTNEPFNLTAEEGKKFVWSFIQQVSFRA